MAEMVEKYGCDSVFEIIPIIENIAAYAKAIVEVVLHGTPDWEFIFEMRKQRAIRTAAKICRNVK